MRNEKMLENAVLVFLVKGDKVLLAKKTRNIGVGCYNGYGGGIKSGETPEKAVARELEKESGGMIIRPEHLEKVAIIDFENKKSDGETFSCCVHVFLARRWIGEPRETEEMADPKWFEIKHLPFKKMMPADKFWVPLVLSGKKIFGKAKYGPFQRRLLAPMEIQELQTLHN